MNGSITTNGVIGKWAHVAFCYTLNSKYELFVDGSNIYTNSTYTSNMGPLLSRWTFGCYMTGSGSYNEVIGGYGMYLDAFRVSDTVRYSGQTYTPLAQGSSYTIDDNTVYINYFDGTNNSTEFTSSEYYYT